MFTGQYRNRVRRRLTISVDLARRSIPLLSNLVGCDRWGLAAGDLTDERELEVPPSPPVAVGSGQDAESDVSIGLKEFVDFTYLPVSRLLCNRNLEKESPDMRNAG